MEQEAAEEEGHRIKEARHQQEPLIRGVGSESKRANIRAATNGREGKTPTCLSQTDCVDRVKVCWETVLDRRELATRLRCVQQ